jgi:hypothetical protein
MKNKTTRQDALLKHLAKGGKLSIKNAWLHFGISNIAREVGRLIEIPFNLYLHREQKTGKTKYGSTCYWFEYSATEKQKKIFEKYLNKKAKVSA